MLLGELLKVLPEAEVSGSIDAVEITGITDDSREAGAGVLFVAVKGEHTDGHDHIDEALQRGAMAVLTERKVRLPSAVGIHVPDTVDALARLSANFHGYPSGRMTLVGITGTNGKTTVSLLVQSILREAGKRPGLIGTLRYEIGDTVLPALNTTPNALHVQSLLRRMADAGMDACVMEVSSHALSLGRVRECLFDARIFTNLTRDHLDFHASMEDYYAVKSRLFTGDFAKPGAASVINADDPWGERLIHGCGGPVLTFGIRNKADFRAMDLENTIHGLCFSIGTPEGTFKIRSPLIGRYNVYNILCSVAAGFALRVSQDAILRGVARVTGIPGRFEKIAGPGFTVVVDYAHTDDALRGLLENAKELCEGRLITIFGCGGDRDRGKRPLMGRAAALLSDRVIVTSDNPRTEDPGRIIQDILEGIKDPRAVRLKVIADRREAIRAGILDARARDMVVVAGKGHEDYQILGEMKIHFDDREEVHEALKLRS